MQFNEVINAALDSLDIYDETGTRIVAVLAPARFLVQAGERRVRLSDKEVAGVRIAVYGTERKQVTGLPEPRDGVWYVVSQYVADAALDRTDLLVPWPLVWDEAGQMIGCKGLSVPHHPVAAHPESRRFPTKEALAELYEQTADEARIPADWFTPYGLAKVLFAEDQISQEEIDLALSDFGDDYTYASGERSNPNYTPTVQDAIEALSTTYRYELRDSAFSDSEIHWVIQPYGDDPEPQGSVADGYIGSPENSGIEVIFPNGVHGSYEGLDAVKLLKAGQHGARTENSSMRSRNCD